MWGLGSWIVATIIYCAWTAPLGITNAGDAAFGPGNLLAAAVLGRLSRPSWNFVTAVPV